MAIIDIRRMQQAFDSIKAHMVDQHGPASDRLRDAFGTAIDNGLIPTGTMLPPERELALATGVSRSTLRRSLKELAELGLVQTRRGAGTTVCGRIPKALSRLSGFSEDMKQRGLSASSRVLEIGIADITAYNAFRTGLPLGTRMLHLVRLRLAGDEPMSYEEATVPVDCVGEDFDGTGSLYQRMDERNARPRRILQSLEAAGAAPDIARLLGIEPGTAVLKISQIGYGPNGTAVEDAISWYRGDRYQYIGEIRG